ncbi:MAG: MarR family winged helix-turn-helix transcriptional regulator [Candidatus Bathyarchaeia archaeon]
MSLEKARRDFRRGNSASRRTDEAMNAIREVLSQGATTFGVLLEQTGLSRRALASNLKRLLKKGEIKRWVDEKDRRLRYYSLDELGWIRYKQQKITQLLMGENVSPLEGIMTTIAEYITAALRAAIEVCKQQGYKLPRLTKDEECIFLNCLHGEIYALGNSNKRVAFWKALTEYLTITKIISERKDVDVRLLKELPDIIFEFKISGDRLIELCENLKKTGKYVVTSDFIRLCKSMSERDFIEFLRTFGIAEE